MTNQSFEDMIGRKVNSSFPPQRIISLVPSITETLFELGLQEEIIGITNYCIHPSEKVKNITKIGGTKNPKIEIIKDLKPDLIIADKNENSKEKVESLTQIAPVYIIEVNNYEDALSMILKLGEVVDKKSQAVLIQKHIKQSFQNIKRLDFSKTVFFPIWKEPCMTINKDTYIHSMLNKIGLTNSFANKNTHYPKVSDKELEAINPDFIFLPSEPCHYTPEDAERCKTLFPNSKVMEVDGQMFAWYGSRLWKASSYFETLLHTLTTDLNS